MNTFCPFLKEICRGNECVMWRNEACLVVSLLQIISEGIPSREEIIETPAIAIHREEMEVPDWIRTRTPEELAVEMLEFKKKEFPQAENIGFYTISDLFWKSRGIERRFVPYEIQLKIERSDILAQNEIRKLAETKKIERFEREREGLPSLVSHCIDWARTNGLKRITLADIDAYIIERKIDILKETRRALYVTAKVKLKSKK